MNLYLHVSLLGTTAMFKALEMTHKIKWSGTRWNLLPFSPLVYKELNESPFPRLALEVLCLCRTFTAVYVL
jgi:hypothetical protein